MDQLVPCSASSMWLHAFIAIVGAVQAIGVAYVVHRAARKNREDKNGKPYSED